MFELTYFFNERIWIVVLFQAGLNDYYLQDEACHLADDIFKCNFFNANIWISITISMNFVVPGPIGNKSALLQ